MSLRSDAVALSTALNTIVATAKSSQSEYVIELTSSIAPLVDRYDQAVFDLHSREDANEALALMADSMAELSAAVAKGELQHGGRNELDCYWRLHTIFRESRYREDTI